MPIKDEISCVCMACLCVGRSLQEIEDEKLKRYYLDALNEIPLCNTTITHPIVCWECKALLKNAIAFREQVKDSYRILRTYTNENLHECLLTDISRPPRLKVHTNVPISFPTATDDAKPQENQLAFVKDERNKFENDQDLTHIKDEPTSESSDITELEIEERKIVRIKNDKKKKKKLDKHKRLTKIESVCLEKSTEDLEQPGRLDDPTLTDILEEDGPRKMQLVYMKDEVKNYDDDKDIEETVMEDCPMSGGSDLDAELENLIGLQKVKKRKSKSEKLKRNKKSVKRLKEKNSKHTKERDTKILTIELSYEEVMAERERDSTRDSYAKAEYKCESCLLGFNYNKSYQAHMAAKHSVELGDYSCPICKTVISSVDSFTAHYKRHMRRYECSICHKRTMDMKVMQQHYYSTHEITLKEYKCNICGKISNSIDTHRYHKDTHKARVQCSECDKTFRHRTGLVNHRLAVHEFHNVFPCTVCDKVFRWKTSLKRHAEKHDTKNKNTAAVAHCDMCEVSFSSLCSYRRHMKNSLKHVTQEQLKFICDHCNRRFADKTKLRDHIEEKHLHKTYQCHICLKPSKNRVSLDQHIRIVHKGRPYNKMCHHCGKGFPTTMQLESHIRTHTGERPFICEYCPTTFSQQSNLNKHNRQVHLNIKTKRSTLCKKRKEDKTEVNPPMDINQPSIDQYRSVVLHYTPDRGFVM